MDKPPVPRALPLHIHISTLVISLILILGLLTSLYNYVKTSNMLVTLSAKRINDLSEDLSQDVEKDQHSLGLAMSILGHNGLTKAKDLQQRFGYLPAMISVLRASKNLTGLQVGYASGDYFIIRPLALNARFQHDAPENAVYIVDNISKQELMRFYTDSEGNRLKPKNFTKERPQHSDYDPRVRPWYQQAMDNKQLYISEVYFFYFAKQLGFTLAQTNRDKTAVIAADLTLGSFSNLINQYSLSSSSQIIVLNDKQQIIAYKNNVMTGNKNTIIKTTASDARIARLDEMQIPIFDEIHKQLKNITSSSHINFYWENERWLAQTTTLNQQGGQNLRLLIASPEKELVAQAIDIRNTSFLIQILAVLFAIPIAWFMANKIAKSLNELAMQAINIHQFDFSGNVKVTSYISEVNALAISMGMMKHTINTFLSLVQTIASEEDLDKLIEKVVKATRDTSNADVAGIFLINAEESALTPHSIYSKDHKENLAEFKVDTQNIQLNDTQQELVRGLNDKIQGQFIYELGQDNQILNTLCRTLDSDKISVISHPLLNRKHEVIGLLFIANNPENIQTNSDNWLAFTTMLSNFSALSLESRQLIQQQKELMQSFIELIASAIDAKSPYTGGHCQRVPKLTKMLALAACESKEGEFKNFELNSDEWEELHLAAWLHDCGKVTTPEYVVNKSTKLETLYDRIHEIRTRFEVLKRDAEIHYLQQLCELKNIHRGPDSTDGQVCKAEQELSKNLHATLSMLDREFDFVAECNLGGEVMAEDKICRLEEIGNRKWLRTLDDRIGISWEESQRKQLTEKTTLPAVEKLLDDKTEHLIERDNSENTPLDNPRGFKLKQPQYKYNRGELYNLSIQHGTLSEEERYKINDHIVQTILMLENLPYPKHLRNVPNIAGGHHEKMDGTGYPRQLTKVEMTIPARMMAIADIFEALTAADRPYKQAKTLSESLKIMNFMVEDQHIDRDLFELFLTAGIFQDYADQYLDSSQIDEVDISNYLA